MFVGGDGKSSFQLQTSQMPPALRAPRGSKTGPPWCHAEEGGCSWIMGMGTKLRYSNMENAGKCL